MEAIDLDAESREIFQLLEESDELEAVAGSLFAALRDYFFLLLPLVQCRRRTKTSSKASWKRCGSLCMKYGRITKAWDCFSTASRMCMDMGYIFTLHSNVINRVFSRLIIRLISWPTDTYTTDSTLTSRSEVKGMEWM